MVLKPQDVVIILKLCKYRDKRPPLAQIAVELAMSPAEVHAGVKRAQNARLVQPMELGGRPASKAVEEFLIHGVKYAFPAERGSASRGIPTSYAAAPLNRLIASGDELPPVWPYSEGETRGIVLEPLYPTVPIAALRDPFLYECLALVDAIREGRVREKKMAERELSDRIRGATNE